MLFLDHGAANVTGGIELNAIGTVSNTVLKKDLTEAPPASGTDLVGNISAEYARKFTLEGFVLTSHGVVDTKVEQTLTFFNQHYIYLSPDYWPHYGITQNSTVRSRTTIRNGPDVSKEERYLQYPLTISVYTGFSLNETTIQQDYKEAKVLKRNNKTVYTSALANSIWTADLLFISARLVFRTAIKKFPKFFIFRFAWEQLFAVDLFEKRGPSVR